MPHTTPDNVPLQLLVAEDSEDDFEILVRELRRGGYAVTAERVSSNAELVAALERSWDLLICDWILPGFGGLQVLEAVGARGLDLACIIVSGTPGEEPAVEALRAGAIRMDLGSATREEAITELTEALAARLGKPGDAARFRDAVLQREALAGTGVGDGVAFPHAEVEGLSAPALAFGRSGAGLDFDAPDGEGARLVFLLLTPPREFERELKLLSEMARLLTRPEVRSGLLSAADERAALAVFVEASVPPPRPEPRSERQRA